MNRILWIVLASAMATQGVAQGGADTGRALAEEACATCHDVAPGGAWKEYPPSFTSIAAFRDEDQILARIMFPQMHSPMPAWAHWLSREEIDDLVAYILSLEGS